MCRVRVRFSVRIRVSVSGGPDCAESNDTANSTANSAANPNLYLHPDLNSNSGTHQN